MKYYFYLTFSLNAAYSNFLLCPWLATDQLFHYTWSKETVHWTFPRSHFQDLNTSNKSKYLSNSHEFAFVIEPSAADNRPDLCRNNSSGEKRDKKGEIDRSVPFPGPLLEPSLAAAAVTLGSPRRQPKAERRSQRVVLILTPAKGLLFLPSPASRWKVGWLGL